MATTPATNSGATSRSFQISYNAVTNSVELSCVDPVEDGGLNISLPASEGEGAKALKILQKMGLAPKDTEADRVVPKTAFLQDRDEDLIEYRIQYKFGYAADDIENFQTIPIGVKKGEKLVCLNLSSSNLPNTMIVSTDGTERTRVIRNIIKYNIHKTHVLGTVIYAPSKPQDTYAREVKHLTNEFELLLFLREISVMPVHNPDHRRVIIIEDFAALVEGMKATSDVASDRTTKAVRAEILSLIQDLSKKREEGDSGRNTHFVFCLESVTEKDYNAFLPTVDARICFGDVGQSSYKLFGKNVNSYSAWSAGRGYIQQEGFKGLFQV